MRCFELHRDVDVTGVSGTGFVAEGCVFDDGTTVVRWRGATPTTTVHADLDSVKAIHLHAGATRMVWVEA